jgi:hypothetical protein
MRRTRRENRFCWLLVTLLITSFLLPPVFATISSEKEKGLTKEEETVLFTPEGHYRAPPALPDEFRENLSLWQLPGYETQLTEGKMLTTPYSDGTIQLQNGWNLISIPKKLLSGYDTAGYVFAGLDSGGRSIWHYNGSTQLWDRVLPGTVLKPLEGYYAYSVGSFTLNTVYLPPAQQPNPSTNLYPGWNMIGFFDPMGNSEDDFLHAAMARDELAQLGGSWSEIQGFDPITQQYETSIINGGSGIHSDYQLMYPEKGYWIWMNSDYSGWTIPTYHTYYCSAEWVNDYHGQQPPLSLSDDAAIGFYEELSSAPNWQGRFIIGDDNGLAQEIHWKEATDSNYIDNTNFAYFAGHGASDRIVFYHPSDENQRSLYYNEAQWGNGQVDWIALDACNVLQESGKDNWKSAFKGLHSIVGWHTNAYAHQNFGNIFSARLKLGDTIWYAWRYAGQYCAPSYYEIAILAVDLDGNPSTRDCVDDHIYEKGQWISPMGNPELNNFVYYREYC